MRHTLWRLVVAGVALAVLAGCGSVQVKVITGNSVSGENLGQEIQAQIDAALSQTDVLKQLAEAQPNSANAHLALGLAYQRERNHTAAVESFSRALAIDPALVDAHRVRAESYAALGQYAQAIVDLDMVIASVPDAHEHLRRRGDLYQQNGQPDRALADYRAFMALAGDDDPALQDWFAAIEAALSTPTPAP